MGNEHSKDKEQPNRNGRIPEKHLNGSANGLSANLSSNGLEISANGETAVQKNSESFSSQLATEPNDFVIVELDRKPAAAPVISEILEVVIHKEEVKESEEDQTDAGLPATNPLTESTSSGEEAAAVIIAVHLESIECPLRKAETWTQTDGIIEADISTQTDKDEDVTTPTNAAPVEDVVSEETGSTEEHPLNVSARVTAEELVRQNGESSDNQDHLAWTIKERVVLFENMVLRREQAEHTHVDHNHPEGESVNGRDELADCVEAVCADAPQSTGFAAVDSSVTADGVATGDNGEGSGDMSVDADVPGTPQQDELDDEPSQKGNSCPEDDIINAEAPNKPVIVEELPVGPEDYEEADPSAVSKHSVDPMWEAAIDALSQELESSSPPPQEAAVAHGLHLIEEVITASTYGGFSGGQEASIAVTEEAVARVTGETNVDATQASFHRFEAVAESVEEEPADVPPMDATGESEPRVSVQEKLKDAEVTPAEVPANSNRVLPEGPVEERSSLLERRPEPSAPIVFMEAMEDGVTRQMMHETHTSAVVDSQTTTTDESMSESFDAVLEAIVEEIINEDVFPADGRLVTPDEVSPEVSAEEGADEDAEKESSVNSSGSTVDSQSVTSTEIEALAETAKQKQESESLTEPESVTPASDEGNQEDNNPEENPVMNFFKSLTTSKITKKETAAPAAVKDQSQKENQPAATTTVAQVSEPPAAPKGMSIPPPPPPEPPKMDFKAEPAAKPVKPTPKEEPKAVAKQPESSKGKSAKDTLSKLFRSKRNKESPTKPDIEVDVQQVVDVEETPVESPEPVVVEVKSENNVDTHDSAEQVAQPVLQAQMVAAVSQPMVAAEKVDSSKAGTLEAAAKPEPPPPVQETKKTASTSSFFSLFKPKAADPKKASPAPAAAAETVKAKEEPKAAAKSSEAVVDNKPASVASQAGGAAANEPKKLEKRNSIHQFFKILGQKRNSTDAGIQTETIAVPPAPEKVK